MAQFAGPNGAGRRLQELLQAKAAHERNWFIEWWNKNAYQAYRDPIVLNVSYFFSFVDDKTFKSQTSRAAAITQAALRYRQSIMDRTLPAEMGKDHALDMITYEYMFNTSRQAFPNVDYTQRFRYDINQHVTVMRKNRIFSFPIYHAGSKAPISLAQTEKYAFVQEASAFPLIPRLGCLSKSSISPIGCRPKRVRLV